MQVMTQLLVTDPEGLRARFTVALACQKAAQARQSAGDLAQRRWGQWVAVQQIDRFPFLARKGGVGMLGWGGAAKHGDGLVLAPTRSAPSPSESASDDPARSLVPLHTLPKMLSWIVSSLTSINRQLRNLQANITDKVADVYKAQRLP